RAAAGRACTVDGGSSKRRRHPRSARRDAESAAAAADLAFGFGGSPRSRRLAARGDPWLRDNGFIEGTARQHKAEAGSRIETPPPLFYDPELQPRPGTEPNHEHADDAQRVQMKNEGSEGEAQSNEIDDKRAERGR